MAVEPSDRTRRLASRRHPGQRPRALRRPLPRLPSRRWRLHPRHLARRTLPTLRHRAARARPRPRHRRRRAARARRAAAAADGLGPALARALLRRRRRPLPRARVPDHGALQPAPRHRGRLPLQPERRRVPRRARARPARGAARARGAAVPARAARPRARRGAGRGRRAHAGRPGRALGRHGAGRHQLQPHGAAAPRARARARDVGHLRAPPPPELLRLLLVGPGQPARPRQRRLPGGVCVRALAFLQ